MENKNYDIIVVGAGPAGNMVAIEGSKRGLKTLVIDKKSEIGSPVRCGENIGEKSLRELGLRADDEWVERYLKRQHYFVLGKKITVKIPTFQLNRKLFEQALAKEAIRKGADYRIRTELLSLIKDNGKIKGVKALSQGRVSSFYGKIIIAADGVDSLTAKMAGFPTENNLRDYASGFQYHLTNLNLEDPDALYFYIDEKALGGYIWIFPRDEVTANVGIGMIPKKGLPHVRTILNNFIQSHPEIFGKAEPLEIVSGGVPLGYPFPALVTDNFMIVGDAAHFVSAISGGGMSWAMFSAKEAVEVAAKAIEEGDCSKSMLLPYQEKWLKGRGKTLRFYYKVRRYAESFDEETVKKAVNILSKRDLDNIPKKGKSFYYTLALKKLPKAIPFILKYRKTSKEVEIELKREEKKILEK
ncbi:MAG TPA: NAD(P)/FAD-dependent oxidoreductase, partial [Thermoplasmata archaeon]|nr:NAD(P)/FAD-dependent oxidoreductase [Thermoplasmata archaeon]